MMANFQRDIRDQLSPSELASLYNFCEWDEIRNAPVAEDLMTILAPDATTTTSAITNTMNSTMNFSSDIKMETMDLYSSPSSLSNEYVAYSVIPQSIFDDDINDNMNNTVYMNPQLSYNNTEYRPYSVIQNSLSEYDLIEAIGEESNGTVSSEDNVEYEALVTHKNEAKRYTMFKRKMKNEFIKANSTELPLNLVLSTINKRTRDRFSTIEINYLLQRLLDERKILIENGYISLYF